MVWPHALLLPQPFSIVASLTGSGIGLTKAFYEVGMEFTHTLDLNLSSYFPPAIFPIVYRELSMPPLHRTAVVNALVHVHMSLYQINQHLSRRQGCYNYVTPRHYLDLYVAI